jgi:hypothetical protein
MRSSVDDQNESMPESLMRSAANDYSSGALMEMGESLVDGVADTATSGIFILQAARL